MQASEWRRDWLVLWAARTVRPGIWRAEKANAKGHVRLKLRAALHFVRARQWVPLLQTVGGGNRWTPDGGNRMGGCVP